MEWEKARGWEKGREEEGMDGYSTHNEGGRGREGMKKGKGGWKEGGRRELDCPTERDRNSQESATHYSLCYPKVATP
jgi:hypothetical protein